MITEVTNERNNEQKTDREILEADIKSCFLVPTNDPPRVIVKRDGFHYSGALHIPDTAKSRPTTGYVIAVPPNGKMDYWLGKRVLFAPLSGTDLKFKSSAPWIALQMEEIIAEITKSNAELDMEFLEKM